ncbi:hypothetical protein LY78DRAFT_167541 [Colletotrichum sublineola]|nr:hypothetical protein LY78DRAFT_167541 [Colletotrichum sublineola]
MKSSVSVPGGGAPCEPPRTSWTIIVVCVCNPLHDIPQRSIIFPLRCSFNSKKKIVGLCSTSPGWVGLKSFSSVTRRPALLLPAFLQTVSVLKWRHEDARLDIERRRLLLTVASRGTRLPPLPFLGQSSPALCEPATVPGRQSLVSVGVGCKDEARPCRTGTQGESTVIAVVKPGRRPQADICTLVGIPARSHTILCNVGEEHKNSRIPPPLSGPDPVRLAHTSPCNPPPRTTAYVPRP